MTLPDYLHYPFKRNKIIGEYEPENPNGISDTGTRSPSGQPLLTFNEAYNFFWYTGSLMSLRMIISGTRDTDPRIRWPFSSYGRAGSFTDTSDPECGCDAA
jgi:hypothetical protein